MRVFVADDYENFRILLADVLRQDGDDIVELRDGPSLLASALARPPDLVITEIALPGMSAIEVVERLRAKRIDVPMILTTTAAPEDVAVDRARHGAVLVLRKPFRLDELRALMVQLLRSAH